MPKKIIYVDMDGVAMDFESGVEQLSHATRQQYAGRLDEVPGIFGLMKPMKWAVTAIHLLHEYFDLSFLSTAPWENPSAWSDKLLTVQTHFPVVGYKRLILSHQKHKNIGDHLIDDRTANGAGEFEGEHIQFGSEAFPDWVSVIQYFRTMYPDFLPNITWKVGEPSELIQFKRELHARVEKELSLNNQFSVSNFEHQ